MISIHDADTMEADYDRLFDTLAQMAADLGIPFDEAEDLINDVILSTLTSRHINDIDTWIAAAFTSAVNQRGGRVS